MDIKVGEHRMDTQGKVWKILRLDDRCAYVRTPDLILDDHREERAFTQWQVRQWPVVQIQPVPEVPAEAPPNDLQWEFDEKTNILSMLIPAAPKPIRVPFGRLEPQMLGTFRGDYLRLFVRSLNHGLSKLDKASKPAVRWEYHPNTRMLVARVDGDGFGCHLAPSTAEDDPYKAINLLTQQLNARLITRPRTMRGYSEPSSR
jgi:hypothetical protein